MELHGHSLPALLMGKLVPPASHTHTQSTYCITVWSLSFLEEQSGCSLLTEQAGCPFPLLTITAELFTFRKRLSPSDPTSAAAIRTDEVVLFVVFICCCRRRWSFRLCSFVVIFVSASSGWSGSERQCVGTGMVLLLRGPQGWRSVVKCRNRSAK